MSTEQVKSLQYSWGDLTLKLLIDDMGVCVSVIDWNGEKNERTSKLMDERLYVYFDWLK
jgi:hypothetical protein